MYIYLYNNITIIPLMIARENFSLYCICVCIPFIFLISQRSRATVCDTINNLLVPIE